MVSPPDNPRQEPNPPITPEIEMQRLQQALELHQTGQLAQAQLIYEDILKTNPRHGDCLHLLGVVASQTENYQRAVDLIGKAIDIYPDNPVFYANHAIALSSLGQLQAAIVSYDKAIALQPNYAEAFCSRGLIQQELQQPEAAVASFDQAIRLKPDYADAWFNRGIALQHLRQPQAAIASYDRTVALDPTYAIEVCIRGGLALQELDRPEAAVTSYDKAIALQPDYAAAWYNHGTALQTLKQFEAALASYDQTLVLQPDFTDAHVNRGIVLQELKRSEAALSSYDQAIALRPDYAKAWFNRGITLKELGRMDAAIASYDRAISLQPNYPEAYSNRGIILRELRELDAALASYDQAIMWQPDYAEAYWNKSLVLLLNGDFAQGWRLYEWRWKRTTFTSPQRNFSQPLWLGKESLHGKTILLHSEQGLGDAIQFCRYVALIAKMGARLVLEVESSLIGLFQQLDGVSELVEKGATLPAFDFHCPLLSLPLACNTSIDSIPGNQQYLRADPKKITLWAARLGTKSRKRVGIVWSGNVLHKNDANRSLKLAELMARLPQDVEYVSLQNEVRDTDKEALAANPHVRHFGSELAEFTDTAALCELMDIVISVDTSVAHLSGALGKPTWILLPHVPDWRWLLDRVDSPWYASAKLYRQKTLGDWDSVLKNIKADLVNALEFN